MKTKLIKTHVKGLYLTSEGKAYRKDLKIEIIPNENGKIRFNGKLYDLIKLSSYNFKKGLPQKKIKQKLSANKKLIIYELKEKGFTKTKINGLQVTKEGLCYNSISNRSLAVKSNKTIINGKAYNVAKILLETFNKIPIRNGQIIFKNGNTKDLRVENLEYKNTITQLAPSENDLIKCIRFYFNIENGFKKSNFLFKFYLNEIAIKRNFINLHNGKGFELFKDWLNFTFSTESKSVYNLSLKHNLTAKNATNEINKYLKLLVFDCFKDSEIGILNIKPLLTKPLTKTQQLKTFKKLVNEL